MSQRIHLYLQNPSPCENMLEHHSLLGMMKTIIMKAQWVLIPRRRCHNIKLLLAFIHTLYQDENVCIN